MQRASEERTFLMAAMYHGGSTLDAVGKRFGVTRERVRQLLRRQGIATRGGTNAADPLRIAAMAKEGMTDKQIGLALGVSAEVVAKCRRALGLNSMVVRRGKVRERMLREYREFAVVLGRTPSATDLTGHRLSPFSQMQAQKHFGGLRLLQREAGLPPCPLGPRS